MIPILFGIDIEIWKLHFQYGMKRKIFKFKFYFKNLILINNLNKFCFIQNDQNIFKKILLKL